MKDFSKQYSFSIHPKLILPKDVYSYGLNITTSCIIISLCLATKNSN